MLSPNLYLLLDETQQSENIQQSYCKRVWSIRFEMIKRFLSSQMIKIILSSPSFTFINVIKIFTSVKLKSDVSLLDKSSFFLYSPKRVSENCLWLLLLFGSAAISPSCQRTIVHSKRNSTILGKRINTCCKCQENKIRDCFKFPMRN